MNRAGVAAAAVLAVLLAASLAAALASAPAAAAPGSWWKQKVDPQLAKKLEEMDPDDEVVVVVRLAGLPPWMAEAVRGDYHAAVAALRAWAASSQEPLAGFIVENGGVVLRRFWIDNVMLVKVPVWLVKTIAADPSVVRIFENFEVRVLEPVAREPVEPGQQVESWGIYTIRAPDVWALGYTGQGARIAVLDTGVDITHPALQGKMFTVNPGDPSYPGGWMEWDLNGNPVCSQPYDSQGHGTHVSGTALGGDTQNILIGVAPGAQLMHGLVLPGGSGTFASVLAGIEWAVAPYDCGGNPTGYPAHVISMSLGADAYYGNDLLPAIENALLANIIVVAAIGNAGQGTSSNPGNIWGVYGVGATDQNDQVAWFSSGEVVNWPQPPASWPFYDTYPSTYVKPDFSAPGVGITSSVPGGGYEAWDGTSMATPHVSGTVALILQAMDALNFNVQDLPELVYEILNSTAVDLGAPGQDTGYGWGRIDAYEAVIRAREYAKPGGVEGHVLDSVDGSPVSWATVTVLETGSTYTVGQDGYFRIPLDPGVYTLQVEAWGYQTKTIQVEVVVYNGTIAGFVYNALTGDPIAGATVMAVEAGASTETGADGSFQLSVPPGTYTVNASAAGFQWQAQSVTVNENETVLVTFNLYPAGNGTVAGYVVDAGTGQPIAGALVWTYVGSTPVYNYTDAGGYYELNLPAGSYTVYAQASGYAQANATVTVYPDQVVQVNFSLQPIPPAVVVVGNVVYSTAPHLASIFQAEGFNVVEYLDIETFLADWMSGNVVPLAVVIDHWKADASTPSLDNVTTLIGLSELNGVPLIFLGTSFSGTTGLDALLTYQQDLEALGYPAPDASVSDWPTPDNVVVDVLNVTHPIFTNVTYDAGGQSFYLADVIQSFFADYRVYHFTDDNIVVLANVTDLASGATGVGVALWTSPSGVLWVFLGSWGESEWMQYIEPGFDGVYSANTQLVLVNAVKHAVGALSTPKTASPEAVERALRLLAPSLSGPSLGPNAYTYVQVYLDRQPYGYVTGRVLDHLGSALPGAVVEAVGTPISNVTDAGGEFLIWLPEGTYTIRITAPGFLPYEATVTVTAGSTVDLGFVQLQKQVRVAILHDYNGVLMQVLSQNGFYAVDYNDITQLTQDLQTGFYDVVVYAGYYNVPFPTQAEFSDFLNAAEQAGVGIVWMDSWGDFGYGIKVLSSYTGDPAVVGDNWGNGNVFIQVAQSHPILAGYQPGDLVEIISYSSADYSWFDGFSGQVLAYTYVGGQVWGASIGVKVTEAGNKWVLLSSFAPTSWNDISFFTADALQIIINSVRFVATEPLSVTLNPDTATVGQRVEVQVSGAPPSSVIEVYLDGVMVGSGVANSRGSATIDFTVPTVPGGDYLVEAMTPDGLYYGAATLTVTSKLTVDPRSVVTPGQITIRATGLQAGQTVYIYIDMNYLSMVSADASGIIEGTLNLPLLPTGRHTLMLVSPVDGSVLAQATITVTNGLEALRRQLDAAIAGYIEELSANLTAVIVAGDQMILAKLDEVNASIVDVVQVSTGEVYLLVNSTYGLLAAKLDEVNASITGLVVDETGRLLAAINTSLGTVLAALDEVEGRLAGLVADETGRLALLVESAYGNLTMALEELNASVASVLSGVDGLYAVVEAGRTEILVRINESTDAILAALGQVNASLAGVVRSETGRLYALIEAGHNTIMVGLDLLNASLAGLIVGESGEVKALVNTSLGTVLARLDLLDAKIVEVGEEVEGSLTVTIQTALGTITARLDQLEATIAGVVRGEAGRLAALVMTAYGNLTIALDDLNASITGLVKTEAGRLEAVIDTSIGQVTASLDELNATVVGLVKTESGEVKALINTALGQVTASLEDVNATIVTTVTDETGQVYALLETAYGDITVKLDEIAGQLPAMKSELESKAAEARDRANQALIVGAAGLTIAGAALALGYAIRSRITG